MPIQFGKKSTTNQTTVFVEYTKEDFTSPKKRVNRATKSKLYIYIYVDHII